MYVAVLSSTSPTISFEPHQITTANNNNNKIFVRLKTRSPPLTLCFVGREAERHDRYGFSAYRRLSSGPSSTFSLSLVADYHGSARVLTIERPKVEIDLKAPTKSASPIPDIDGGGNDDGGDGDGGGIGDGGKPGPFGDDDDYQFHEEDSGVDEKLGFFRRRRLVPELFDRRTANAVLSEWMRTIKDLPLGLKEACEMGILSSADLTKFLFFNLRPTIARLLAHRLPQQLLTDFNGKLMADPSLTYKLVFEALFSVGWSVWLDSEEYRHGERQRMKQEWYLVLTNAITNAACNTFFVWSLAPTNGLINWPKLPKNVNSVFEKSQRIKKFDIQRRLLSFFHKGIAFFALGFAAKSATQIIRLEKKKTMSFKESASLGSEALAAGVSMALLTNLRYQLIWGMDRSLDLYFDVTKASLAFCLALRFMNVGVGTRSLNWVWSEDQGVFANGFGLFDISTKTKNQPAAKKKRVIRKKMAIAG